MVADLAQMAAVMTFAAAAACWLTRRTHRSRPRRTRFLVAWARTWLIGTAGVFALDYWPGRSAWAHARWLADAAVAAALWSLVAGPLGGAVAARWD